MNKQRLVDTNVIVRYLVQDHDKHARAAGKLFDACDRGDVVVVVLPVVLAECVFVLESFYGHPRAAIASALGGLICQRRGFSDRNSRPFGARPHRTFLRKRCQSLRSICNAFSALMV